MSLLAELEEFARGHRRHGTMTGDATEPAWNGYLLTVACPCGVVFERWVTPDDAELDLALLRAAELTLRGIAVSSCHHTNCALLLDPCSGHQLRMLPAWTRAHSAPSFLSPHAV